MTSHPHSFADEGTIKYSLDYRESKGPEWNTIRQLEGWRRLFYKLQLIGRNTERYGGLAYGNVSLRLDQKNFLISGSQTGGMERLQPEHYTEVLDYDTQNNHLIAAGPTQPSSEALTHAAIYEGQESARCVIHVHSKELWESRITLAIPTTPPDIAYGTPEMAIAVACLAKQTESRVIAMGGHRDGIIAFGNTEEEAAYPLLRLLAEAVSLS